MITVIIIICCIITNGLFSQYMYYKYKKFASKKWKFKKISHLNTLNAP